MGRVERKQPAGNAYYDSYAVRIYATSEAYSFATNHARTLSQPRHPSSLTMFLLHC